MLLSSEYDHRALRRYAIKLMVMVALYKATGGFAALLVPFLVLFTLAQRKPIESMFWVLFMTLTSIGNPAIFSRNAITVMTTRVTLVTLTFIVSSKVFAGRGARVTLPFWGIIPYIIWEAMISIQGYSPIVSYLKLFLFTCIFFAAMGVANEVNASSRVNARILRSMLLCVVGLIILGSVALIPFPGLSLMAVDEQMLDRMLHGEYINLFCGICSHSQAMGPVAGVLGTFIFADLVFSIKEWDRLYLALVLAAPVLIYKTSSRTGMGTYVAGISMVVLFLSQSKGLGSAWKQRVTTTITTCFILGAILMLAVPTMRTKVTDFALKWGEKGTKREVTMTEMFSSRQGKIEQAMYGFKKNPVLGNGFQVSEDMAHENRKGILSYLAAPIEKGIWIYAVLEEGGVIGFILFSGWLLILFPLLFQRKAYIMASTFFAVIMTNVGEFSLFAMTYVGGFYWTLTFAAGTLDVQRLKNQKVQTIWNVPVEIVMEEVGMDEWVREKG